MRIKIQKNGKGHSIYIEEALSENFQTSELALLRDTIDTYLANLPKPHVHAELMALYAKDAAETDKPWERWEKRLLGSHSADKWHDVGLNHYLWQPDWQYRRKEGV